MYHQHNHHNNSESTSHSSPTQIANKASGNTSGTKVCPNGINGNNNNMSVSSTSNPNTRKTGQDTPDSANGSVDSGCSRDHEDQDQSIMEIDPQQLLNEWLSELENLQIVSQLK